jgi:hypothetical protein
MLLTRADAPPVPVDLGGSAKDTDAERPLLAGNQRPVYTAPTGNRPGLGDAWIWSNERASTTNSPLLTGAPTNPTAGRWTSSRLKRVAEPPELS